jgi:hypothetical protein
MVWANSNELAIFLVQLQVLLWRSPSKDKGRPIKPEEASGKWTWEVSKAWPQRCSDAINAKPRKQGEAQVANC